MYKCQICKAQSKPGQGQIKRVSEKRAREYENTIRRGKKAFTVKSVGSETVSEVAVCPPCSTRMPE